MSDINEETRQRLLKAAKNDIRLGAAAKSYFERAGGISRTPDFTIFDTKLSAWGPWEETINGEKRGNQGGFCIEWQTVSAGFGQLILYIDHDNNLKIENQGMGKEFCKSVLAKLIDNIDDQEFLS